MNSADLDNFETLLSNALRSRPERAPSMDLAAEALRRAAIKEAHELRLKQLAFWRRVATVAAAIVIGAIVLIGYCLFPESTSDSAVTDTATASATVDLTSLGMAALILTLIGIVLATLLSSERPQLRVA